MRRFIWVVLWGALAGGCSNKAVKDPAALTPTPGWNIISPAVKEGQPIDKKYTCDGDDVSPPLSWPAPPGGVKSLALIMDDPDAPSGTFTHWVLWGMAPDRSSLPEAVAKQGEVASVGRQGKNGFGDDKLGYGGPCPPSGTHRYRFKLFGLSTKPELAAGSGRDDLEKAMAGQVIAYTILTGTYQRPAR
jgi:Raf kinase inhibitor-like YbhB/YbcL family protein